MGLPNVVKRCCEKVMYDSSMTPLPVIHKADILPPIFASVSTSLSIPKQFLVLINLMAFNHQVVINQVLYVRRE